MVKSLKGRSAEFWFVFSYVVIQCILVWAITFSFMLEWDINGYFLKIFDLVIIGFYLIKIDKTKKIMKPRGAELLLIFLSIWAILSLIFSGDFNKSLNGEWGRCEGIFSILFYYMIFVIASHIKDESEKKTIIAAVIVQWIIGCYTGYLGGLGFFNELTYFGRHSHDIFKNPMYIAGWKDMACIPYGNPNFFGTVATMATALGLGMFLYSEKRKKIEWIGLLLFFWGVIAVYATTCSSPIVGSIMSFAIVVFAEIVICRRKKEDTYKVSRIKKIVVALALYVGIVVYMNQVQGGAIVAEMQYNASSIEEGVTNDNALTGRMQAWKATIRQIPHYWLWGVGLDNFYEVSSIERINDTEFGIYDKAHNEYLQIAITEGLPSIIVYLVFLFVIFIGGLKKWDDLVNKGKWMYLSFFIMFFAYIAQAFFNIRMIYLAPYFWIMTGMLYSAIKKTENDVVVIRTKENNANSN